MLWEGLVDGTIDFIVSDHSPSTLDLKDLDNGDFGVAWGGVSSLILGLSLIWTEARLRGIGLERVVEWMSTKPAQRAGLRTKGRLSPGYDADVVGFAPDDAFVVGRRPVAPQEPHHPVPGQGAVRDGPEDLRPRRRRGLRDAARSAPLLWRGLTDDLGSLR